jgi:archaellum component FlaC
MIQKSEHNLTDVVLSIDSLSNKIEITNQLLREIRNDIENAPDRTKDVVSKLDKMAGACNEIKSNTTHLIDIKKDVNRTNKATTSIDQRLSGINQMFASQKIAVDKIKSMVERFVSGK